MKQITDKNTGGPALLATPADVRTVVELSTSEPPIALLAAPVGLGEIAVVGVPRDPNPIVMPAGTDVDEHARIAARAYELYLERGSVDGDDVADWLAAELEIRGGGTA